MKTLALLIVASGAFAQSGQPTVANAQFETRAFTGNLESQIRAASPTWFGYAIKTMRGDRQNCCWNGNSQCACSLEGKNGVTVSGTNSSGPVQLEGSDTLAVLFRVTNNAVEKIQAYTLSCSLDAGGLPFVWLTGVPARASLPYLQKLVATGVSNRPADGAIFAIAQHDDPQADTILEQLTRPAEAEHIREKTTFWLGASRGARGVTILKNVMAGDPSEHVRDKAVFALSISKQPEALDTLIQSAKTDASPHVRGQAIFWLAQKAGKRASSTITDAIENDPDTSVKKRAVFALSQLPKDEGVPKLIEVARSQRNPEVRKQAFFWLGQSRDPRALEFIQDILTK
jgi:hypothetical protein